MVNPVIAIVGSIAGVMVGQFFGHLVEAVYMSKEDSYVADIIDKTDMGKKAYDIINV